MKSVSFYIIAIIALGFSSCTKEQITYQFDGVIVNNQNGIGIDGAEIEIRQKLVGSTSSSLNHTLAASELTDANGVYRVIIERDKVTEFKYVVSKDGYFDQEAFESSQFVDVGKPNIRNYTMEPRGYVKFDIENVGGVNADDELILYGFNFKEGCGTCFTNGHNYFYDDVDTAFTVSSTAYQYVRFFYQDVYTGSTVNDSVYIPFNDTIEYIINF